MLDASALLPPFSIRATLRKGRFNFDTEHYEQRQGCGIFGFD